MTDLMQEKAKQKKPAEHERITTHPSYRQYTLDEITNQKKKTAVAPARPRNEAEAKRAVALRAEKAKAEASAKTAAARKASSTALEKRRTESPAKSAKKVRTKVRLNTIAAEKKYSFPVSIVLTALLFTGLIMMIITSSVEISAVTASNVALQNQYAATVKDANELRLLLETRDDLRVVEEMARNELGMVKKDEVAHYYISVRQQDKIELVEQDDVKSESLIDRLVEFGSSFVNRIRAFFGF